MPCFHLQHICISSQFSVLSLWVHGETHRHTLLTAWEEAPSPQQSWSLGIQEFLRPGVQSSFSPHAAHSDRDTIKLPPDSGALHHPPCKPCIPSHPGEQAVPAPGPWAASREQLLPQGLHHLLADSGTSPCSRTFQGLQEGRLTTPLSLALPLPSFLFLLAGRQPILFIALNSRVIR